MSWVALEKPIRKRKNMKNWNQDVVRIVKATPAKAAPSSICIRMTQKRFVLKMSMKGLHRGLMIQGSCSQLVYKAICVFVSPIWSRMTTETEVTITLGSPSAAYTVGIHHQGDLVLLFSMLLSD